MSVVGSRASAGAAVLVLVGTALAALPTGAMDFRRMEKTFADRV